MCACVRMPCHPDIDIILFLLILAAGCTSQDCLIPVHPPNGKHMPYEGDCPPHKSSSPECRGVPGTRVRDGWFLFVNCNDGYILDNEEHGFSQSTCADGRWLPSLSSCIYNITNDDQKCAAPPYPENGKYTPLPIECALNSNSPENLLLPGTFLPPSCVLLYSCNEGYELSDEDVISICDGGKWNPKVITCKLKKGFTEIDTNDIRRDTDIKGCLLPSQQDNRKYCSFQCKECDSKYGDKCSYLPGSVVKDYIIKVQCDEPYRLNVNYQLKQNYLPIACSNGSWNAEFPQCHKLCPPLTSDSVYAQCFYGNSEIDCSEPVLPSTTVIFQCRPSHLESIGLKRAGVCKSTGKWTTVLPECEPVCGISKGNLTVVPTISNGEDTKLGVFPWHAGLYRKDHGEWNCICGGTLITNRIILTAAHCVVGSKESELRLALGKYYRSWTHNEEYAVKRNVSVISYPREYNGGTTTYAFDIALLLMSMKVQINSYVMPVCRSVHLSTKSQNNIGFVVGWGKTAENGKESETLLHSDLTILDYSICIKKIPRILSFDKFCGTKGQASVAEKGDSGGGLTTIINDQHYITGIVSLKFGNMSVFTNVSWPTHKNWIENEIINFDKRY